jgi:hypothetical protein
MFNQKSPAMTDPHDAICIRKLAHFRVSDHGLAETYITLSACKIVANQIWKTRTSNPLISADLV